MPRDKTKWLKDAPDADGWWWHSEPSKHTKGEEKTGPQCVLVVNQIAMVPGRDYTELVHGDEVWPGKWAGPYDSPGKIPDKPGKEPT